VTAAGSSYCDEYAAVYNAMTTKPTTYANAQDTLVQELKTAGIWTKLDVFYVFAQGTNGAGEACLNWIAPTGDDNCTVVSGAVFTANEGFVGDATADELDTNWNPSTESTTFLNNATTIFAYCRVTGAANAPIMGCIEGSNQIRLNPYQTNASAYINSSSGAAWNATNSQGLWLATKDDATHVGMYRNAVDLGTPHDAVTNQVRPNATLRFLSNGTNFTNNQVSVGGAGGLLNGTEISALNTAIEKYMDRLGKGVE
jgi:hypothetical protein